MNYIILFFAHSGAIKFNRNMSKKGQKCELKPVPRVLSSSCGVCADIITNENYRTFIDDEHIECIYELLNGKYKLLYSAD